MLFRSVSQSRYGGYTISVNGNTQVDTAYKKFGTGSVLFDGNGDYLFINGVSGSKNFNYGDLWGIDFWCRLSTVAADQYIFGYSYDTGGDTSYHFRWDSANQKWCLFASSSNVTIIDLQVSDTIIVS